MSLKKQVFGYNKSQVDELINEKDNEIKTIHLIKSNDGRELTKLEMDWKKK